MASEFSIISAKRTLTKMSYGAYDASAVSAKQGFTPKTTYGPGPMGMFDALQSAFRGENPDLHTKLIEMPKSTFHSWLKHIIAWLSLGEWLFKAVVFLLGIIFMQANYLGGWGFYGFRTAFICICCVDILKVIGLVLFAKRKQTETHPYDYSKATVHLFNTLLGDVIALVAICNYINFVTALVTGGGVVDNWNPLDPTGYYFIFNASTYTAAGPQQQEGINMTLYCFIFFMFFMILLVAATMSSFMSVLLVVEEVLVNTLKATRRVTTQGLVHLTGHLSAHVQGKSYNPVTKKLELSSGSPVKVSVQSGEVDYA